MLFEYHVPYAVVNLSRRVDAWQELQIRGLCHESREMTRVLFLSNCRVAYNTGSCPVDEDVRDVLG